MAGESSVSIGGIEERAAKLEEATKAAAEKPETPAAETKVESSATIAEKPAAIVPGMAPAAKTEEKKAPNDPDELRKWNTRVSMENKQIKDQLSTVQKQLEDLAAAFNKTAKKAVDWKDLAKDPAKLQAAVEEQQKQLTSEWEQKYNKHHNDTTARITQLENKRRMHDPAYPRWAELQSAIVDLAVKADPRVDFSKDPVDVLDQMYDLAQQAKPGEAKPAAAAPVLKSYTDADMAAAREEARKEALAEAQKGLAAEEKGAGVGGMGKGAPKGKPGVDKEALWNMPMKDLKSMIQKASDK